MDEASAAYFNSQVEVSDEEEMPAKKPNQSKKASSVGVEGGTGVQDINFLLETAQKLSNKGFRVATLFELSHRDHPDLFRRLEIGDLSISSFASVLSKDSTQNSRAVALQEIKGVIKTVDLRVEWAKSQSEDERRTARVSEFIANEQNKVRCCGICFIKMHMGCVCLRVADI